MDFQEDQFSSAEVSTMMLDAQPESTLSAQAQRPSNATPSSATLQQNYLRNFPMTEPPSTPPSMPDSVESQEGRKEGSRGISAIPTRLHNVPGRVLHRTHREEKEVTLDEDYVLRPEDVLCLPRGSQESSSGHPGNARFRVLVMLKAERYRRATSSQEKAIIGREVVEAVRATGAKFVRKDEGGDVWYEIGNRKAREKARHALRAAVDKLERREARASFSSTDSSRRSAATYYSDGGFAALEEESPLFPSTDTSELPWPEPISLKRANSWPQEPEGFREFVRSTFLRDALSETDESDSRLSDSTTRLSPFGDHCKKMGSLKGDSSCDPKLD